jgi:hypothetical protein
MQDDRRQQPGQGAEPQDPAEAGRQDVERATEHAERKLEEIKEEVRREIDRTEATAKDRDEVGERPVPPKSDR